MSDIGSILGGAKTFVQSARGKIVPPISILVPPIPLPFGDNGSPPGTVNGIPNYEPPPRFDENGNPLTYTDIQQQSSHNSYNRNETILEQYQNQNITSFELDIHNGDPGLNVFGENLAENGDFYVYHDSIPINFGNMGSNTHYPHLTDGLADIAAIHELNPKHDVITLHIDVKDMFDPENGLGAADLDRVLREQLGEDVLYTPNDLINASGADNLGEAFQENGMPTLNDMEGRVMIVLTGGDAELEAYLAGTENPIGFISANPEIDVNGNFVPNEDAVFYNIKVDDLDVAPQILDEDYILRAYGANDATSYQEALDAGVHHIGTDFISPGDDNIQTPVSNEIFHQGENIQDAVVELKDAAVDGFNETKDTVVEGAQDIADWSVDRAEDVADWSGDRVDDAIDFGGDVVDFGDDVIDGTIDKLTFWD